MPWHTSERVLSLEKTLIMGILNVTPDSFSDGGEFSTPEAAIAQAGKMIDEGADIIDIGGESTRPGSARVSAAEEIARVVPVIEALAKRFVTPISIDTSKSEVAEASVRAGAEIINDVSGLQFDPQIAGVAAKYNTGLVLMHLRGTFETMHAQEPVEDILQEVAAGFRSSIAGANTFGVPFENIALDPGLGFSKTFGQNLELLAKLGKLKSEFTAYPILIGTSRKSFIGKVLGDGEPRNRIGASAVSAAIAVMNGADIVRVHDIRETVEAVKMADAIKNIT